MCLHISSALKWIKFCCCYISRNRFWNKTKSNIEYIHHWHKVYIMYRHIALSLILVLQLTNLKLVSTFITCRKSYNFEKDTSCYHVKYEDQNRFHYKTASSRKCQLRCDEDPRCTKYFHNLELSGCYLSQCKSKETCNDKFSIYPFTDYCPWIRYTKGWWQFLLW